MHSIYTVALISLFLVVGCRSGGGEAAVAPARSTDNPKPLTSTERQNMSQNNTNQKSATENEAASFAEYQAVEKALQPYIQSAKSGDGALSRSAFFDHAHIVGSVQGEFYNMDADTFGETVTQGGPAPEVQHHIAWIDISGPAAAAKVEFINWGGFRFTDFFVLYKNDGQWKISGKVYDSHNKN